jgi:tRNA(fMet)-specific endonuclease VapC
VLIASERDAGALDAAIADDDDVAIAAITAAELLVGIELADKKRRRARASFVDDLLKGLPVQDYGLATARAHARLLALTRRAGRPRGAHDLIIAATALESNRIVVTADARGFADLPGVTVRALGTT